MRRKAPSNHADADPPSRSAGAKRPHYTRVQTRRYVRANIAWNLLLGPLEFERFDYFFPVLSIECSNLDFSPFSIKVVETTDIDAVHVRGRTGIAKWMNAAVFTEPVFGCFRPELIERQRILPREQLEALRRNTMMQGPLLCTDGTVAFNGLSEVGFDLKPNLATMTTTLIRSHDQL